MNNMGPDIEMLDRDSVRNDVARKVLNVSRGGRFIIRKL